jgi:hypothetical protein
VTLHRAELDPAIDMGLRKGSQYSQARGMVDFRCRMLNIARAKNEESIHVPLNDAAAAAQRIGHNWGDGRKRVFQSVQIGKPLENGVHWFSDAVMEARIKNFGWRDLRQTFAIGCE